MGAALQQASEHRLRQLGSLLDERMEALNERFLSEVCAAAHLTNSDALSFDYYVRHRIETIKRIRLTARTDALALAAMVRDDYDAAREWARYACEELDHDSMFCDDLARQGISREQIDGTPLLAATVALDSYLHEQIAEHGSLSAVAYSLFVEWNSERFSRAAVEKAALSFGAEAVEGSRSHLGIDEGENHYAVMMWIAERLTRGKSSEQLLLKLIDEIAALFRAYFDELAAASLVDVRVSDQADFAAAPGL